MQNFFRPFLVLVAFVLIFVNFNSAKAQYGPAHFEELYPSTVYLLPDEYFSNPQQVYTDNWSMHRLATFDLWVSHGEFPNSYFDGCEEWMDYQGTLLENDNGSYYNANWIANAPSQVTMFQSFRLSFNNSLPVGTNAGYMASIHGEVLVDNEYFEHFEDYLEQQVISMDGIRGDANGDGEVTGADVDSLQLYCFAPWFYDNWRYTAEGVNIGRAMILFSEPTLLDGYLINAWLYNPNDPLIADLGIGELISSTTYGYGGSSAVQPAPYELTVNNNELTVNTNGLAVAIFGNLPDGTTWQSSSWTNNGTADFQLPEDLQNMRIEAVQIEGATDVNTPVEQPSAISLQQNYPNPFNPTTTIEFDLQSASQTSFKVYDLNGQMVATLADGQMSAGQHSIAFDGSAMASGVYVYTLTTNGQTQSHKMILMK